MCSKITTKIQITRNKNKQAGFSVIEILAVIAIITMGMLGLLSLATQSIRSQFINKNNLIASQLAQEGIEAVRNIRDTNWKNGLSWNTGFSIDGNYKWDIISKTLSSQPALLLLKIDSTSGYYNYTLGQNSIYNRNITISNGGVAATSTTVTANVYFKEGQNNRVYSAETVLYNWRQ